MNSRHALISIVAVSCLASLSVAAGVVMDGTVDAKYGAPLAIQNVQTQFGDSNLGQIGFANGSELNVAHGFIDEDGGYLRLFFAGNLESNFNKLEVFIDYKDGGQTTLRGDNPDVDFNGLNRMGAEGKNPGLTFDESFAADFYVTTTCGGDPFSTFANTAQILTDGGGSGEYIGSGSAGAKGVLNGSNGTLIAYDNSNTRGVTAGTEAASGEGVTTGIEIALPLSLIADWGGGDIKVCVFVNGGGHDFLSNQILAGAGGGTSNLGEPRLVNFQAIAGDQFFVVPGLTGGTCTGDLTGDNFVDGADLGALLGAWGPCSGCTADITDDGFVDGADLGALLGAWGPCQ